MKRWYDDLIVGVIVVAIIGGIIGGLMALVNHSKHVSCLRLHEQIGLETRYARSGAVGECYVHLKNGDWVPEKRWRGLDE